MPWLRTPVGNRQLAHLVQDGNDCVRRDAAAVRAHVIGRTVIGIGAI